MRSLFCLVFLVGFSALQSLAQEVAALPVVIAPDHALMRYTGRFDTRDTAGPRCGLPGSTIAARFSGTAINAAMTGNGSRFEILIDGKSIGILKLQQDRKTYRIAENLPPDQPHTLELFQRTEALFGTVQFLGFQLENGQTLSQLPPRPERCIEFIGDSITCGYGNEAASEKEHFSPITENHYLAFGPLTARALGAEATSIAWTGAFLSDKAPPGRIVIPQVYPRALPDRPKSLWDFSKWTPQVVVVNLGTNDFSGQVDVEDWTKQYREFLAVIRSHYPDTHIFLCTGPMLGGASLAALRQTVRSVAEAELAEKQKVHYVEFPAQRIEDGIGADYHPSLKTHQNMANQLTVAIRQEIGW